MSRPKGKLGRKARRVIRSEREQELREALGKIRAERDKTLHGANRAFDKAVEAAHLARGEARKAAHDLCEEKRATILKAFARDGIEVDAA